MTFYFFLRSPSSSVNYHHPLVTLAEGLRELGHSFGANRDYWPEEGGAFLFQKGDIGPYTADILVADSEWFAKVEPLPKTYLQPKRHQRTIWFDHSDGVFFEGAFSPDLRDWPKRTWVHRVDHIFRSHFVDGWTYPKNVVPSAFGLSNRMVTSLGSPRPYGQRDRGILANFRVAHAARRVFRDSWSQYAGERLPLLERFTRGKPVEAQALAWYEATGGRHHPDYYSLLKNATHCSAIGGYFGPAAGKVMSGGFHHRLGNGAKTDNLGERVYQFDSWRLWESLAAGCVTILPNLERYGCRLPMMPTHGTHYFGFDFSRPQESWEELLALEPRWEEIGQAGRAWALEHYSPAAMARRTLGVLGV